MLLYCLLLYALKLSQEDRLVLGALKRKALGLVR
jgi:hypothetical protein